MLVISVTESHLVDFHSYFQSELKSIFKLLTTVNSATNEANSFCNVIFFDLKIQILFWVKTELNDIHNA